MIDCDDHKYPGLRKQVQDEVASSNNKLMEMGLLTIYISYHIIDNSSPIQYSSSSAVGMKDSNNAVPE